jgi:DNA modification methylase
MTPYYEDSAVKLYLGDCRDILPQLDAVDHVITDPPYDEHTHSMQRRGSSAPGRGKQFGLSRESISVARHVGFEALAADDMRRLSSEFARLGKRWVLVFCAMEQQADWQASLGAVGLEHVRFGVWHKPGSTPQFSGDRPGTACEAIEIAHPKGRKRWNGGGGFGMWTAPIVKAQTGERCHPTQKPEDLMAQLVGDFTDPGDLILDPFGGSGTTAVAAKRLGRRCILIEREEKYCEVAASRLSQAALELYAAPEHVNADLLSSDGTGG